MPQNAAEHGYLTDHMLEMVHWFMLLLFVGWSVFFVVSLVRFRKSRSPRADYHGVQSKASTHVEFTVVLVEAALLLGFALPLWGMRVSEFPKDDPVIVRAVGEQYRWSFHYPGPDKKFGRQDALLITASNALGLDPKDPNSKDDVITSNDLHLPVNRSAIIQVSSKDVIHSLSLQAMRIGQDAIPGISTPIWFRPVRIGTYEIVCGQLCGLGHYAMRALMTIETEADYEQFLKDSAPQPAAQ